MEALSKSQHPLTNRPLSLSPGTQKILLRREWFGGLEVHLPDWKMIFLDEKGFMARKKELENLPSIKARITIVDSTELGYPLRKDSLSTPGSIFIETTRRCDARCRHCYADALQESESEMSTDMLTRFLKRCAELGVYYVRLTGGEPTLRNDNLLTILDVIKETVMRPSINTHGRYGEKKLHQILERGVKDIRISLEGDKSCNDAIRGTGCYDEVMATMHRLAEYNKSALEPTDPTINFVMMKSNQHCLESIIAKGAEFGFKVSIGLMRPSGRANLKEMLSAQEVANAAFDVERIRNERCLPDGRVRMNFDVFRKPSATCETRPFPFNNSKCPMGTMGFGVESSGRIVACNFLARVDKGKWLGENIADADIMHLWNHSPILKEARAVQRHVCQGCQHYKKTCNGGCPVTAQITNGQLDGRDPYCISHIPMPDTELRSSNVCMQ